MPPNGPLPSRQALHSGNRDWTATLVVGGIALVAFALRVAVSYRAVFGQEYVSFIENDAWYHMRLVDGLIQHFPWRIWHDAYALHPGGEPVNVGPMLDWIIAGIALIIGAGAPTPRMVDVVGAFVPPAIGALTVIPVYLLGRDLFSRRAGLWAALCAAVMPGSFFIRSALGFTDHHCAEALLTTLALVFIVRAAEPGRTARDRRKQGLAAGVTLGAYLLTWGGGALFVATLFAWATLELIIATLRHDDSSWMLDILAPAFGVAALMTLPWTGTRPYFAYDELALIGGIGALALLHVLGRVTARLRHAALAYSGILALIGAAVAIVLVLPSSPLPGGLVLEMERLSPLRTSSFVSEAVPLMRSSAWRPVPLWSEFTTSLPLSLLGLAAILFVPSVQRSRVRLLLTWGAVTLAATFGQVRFAYYLAIPVAILAGYACDLVVRRLAPRVEGSAGDTPAAAGAVTRPARLPLAATVLLAAAIAAPGSRDMLKKMDITATLGPDWFDALQWMRTNTPEPFGTPDAYTTGGDGGESSYGVMSWWDFGYWITRVARRAPITNPKQSAISDAAQFFLASDPREATAILDRVGARYVIADVMLQISVTRSPTGPGFFAAIARVDNQPRERFCEALLPPAPDSTTPVLYCYPEYYQTMAVRLYAFGGQAVTPQSAWVIDIQRGSEGAPSRVRSEWSFPTYEDAERFVRLRPAGNLRVVSKDPLSTCVPLDAVPNLRPVYRSIGRYRGAGTQSAPPLVQVFEYRSRS